MRLVLLDLDGTLIDSEQGITASIEHALRTLGAPIPPREALREWIGPPLRASFPQLLGADPARTEQAVALYRERFDAVGWREHAVYAGIAEVVMQIAAQGAQLAVVTTKVAPYAQRIVDHLPFGTCFQATYSPAQGSAHSEKATMIAQALRDFSCAAHDAVMIGDRRFDIEGAHANHVRAIGVSWGFGSIAELRAAQADVIADEPAQLPALLAP